MLPLLVVGDANFPMVRPSRPGRKGGGRDQRYPTTNEGVWEGEFSGVRGVIRSLSKSDGGGVTKQERQEERESVYTKQPGEQKIERDS